MILSMQCNGCFRFAHRKPSRVDRIKPQTGSHQPPALLTQFLSFSLSQVLAIVDYYTLAFLIMQAYFIFFYAGFLCINLSFTGKNLFRTKDNQPKIQKMKP